MLCKLDCVALKEHMYLYIFVCIHNSSHNYCKGAICIKSYTILKALKTLRRISRMLNRLIKRTINQPVAYQNM